MSTEHDFKSIYSSADADNVVPTTMLTAHTHFFASSTHLRPFSAISNNCTISAVSLVAPPPPYSYPYRSDHAPAPLSVASNGRTTRCIVHGWGVVVFWCIVSPQCSLLAGRSLIIASAIWGIIDELTILLKIYGKGVKYSKGN